MTKSDLVARIRTFVKKNLSLAIFIVAAFAIRWSLTDQYYIPSGSMEPTLQIGDRILVNKMAYDFRIPYTRFVVGHVGDPKRGDIVVFENPQSGITMVKRLIGLPGETIVVDDGFVTVNGHEISGSREGLDRFKSTNDMAMIYAEHIEGKDITIQRLPLYSRPHHIEFKVPEDSFFAMGDNRDNSSDSRVWGFIPRELLKGRAFAVFWSLRFEDYIPHLALSRTAQKIQ